MADKKKAIKVKVEGETSEDNCKPMSSTITVDRGWLKSLIKTMKDQNAKTMKLRMKGDVFVDGNYTLK